MANVLRPISSTRTPAVWPGESSFVDLWRRMDRLFDDFTRGSLLQGSEGGFINPAVDICESEEGIELKAELPGIAEKDIDIEYNEGMLTLRAERNIEKEDRDEKKRYHVMERAYGTFLRRFRLPFEADPNSISASFDKGVVTVHIPRPAGTKSGSKHIRLDTRH